MKDKCSINIQITYIILIILWTLITILFYLYNTIACLILFIPYVIFIYSIIKADNFPTFTQKELLAGSFITIVIVIAVPLLNFLGPKINNTLKQSKMEQLMIFTVIIALFSLIPIIVEQDHVCIWRHLRIGLEIMSLILFIYILLNYFIELGSTSNTTINNINTELDSIDQDIDPIEIGEI